MYARRRGIMLPLFLLAAMPTWANYTCVGPVYGLSVGPTGYVSASSVAGISWPYICSVTGSFNNISVDACKTVYATLLSAQMGGKTVTLWFNDEPNTCTMPSRTWTTLTGWYWGPMVAD